MDKRDFLFICEIQVISSRCLWKFFFQPLSTSIPTNLCHCLRQPIFATPSVSYPHFTSINMLVKVPKHLLRIWSMCRNSNFFFGATLQDFYLLQSQQAWPDLTRCDCNPPGIKKGQSHPNPWRTKQNILASAEPILWIAVVTVGLTETLLAQLNERRAAILLK